MIGVVGYNFASVDREQLMLMPPSVAEWVPEDHLAWFVLDVVEELDLTAFLAAYRGDGRGGSAYHPKLMLALLVYAYCVGERSSRRIERRLVEDVAFRVVAANQRPDHATISRFRAVHEQAIAGLFGQVLAICDRAGVLRSGLAAIDGTKLSANAAKSANRTAEQLARDIAKDILAEAEAVDAAEDARTVLEGEEGEGIPPELRTRAGRRQRLRELKDQLEAEAEEKSYERAVAKRAAHEAETGRPAMGRRPKPTSGRYRSRKHANVTDPDSRLLKTHGGGYQQGYNAQAVATIDQYVIAAEVTNLAVDAAAYEPMITTTKENLDAAGGTCRIDRVVADAGYWSGANADLEGVESFIAPGRARNLATIAEKQRHRAAVLERVEAGQIDKPEAASELGVSISRINQLLLARRKEEPEQLTTTMMAKLDSPTGRRVYQRRAASIEPVFAQIKHNRGIRTMSRRGKAAADSEWKLICATHNLLKIHRTA